MDKEERILPAVAMLASSTVLGVDCEWEPTFQASKLGLGADSSPTSTLQVTSTYCMGV